MNLKDTKIFEKSPNDDQKAETALPIDESTPLGESVQCHDDIVSQEKATSKEHESTSKDEKLTRNAPEILEKAPQQDDNQIGSVHKKSVIEENQVKDAKESDRDVEIAEGKEKLPRSKVHESKNQDSLPKPSTAKVKKSKVKKSIQDKDKPVPFKKQEDTSVESDSTSNLVDNKDQKAAQPKTKSPSPSNSSQTCSEPSNPEQECQAANQQKTLIIDDIQSIKIKDHIEEQVVSGEISKVDSQDDLASKHDESEIMKLKDVEKEQTEQIDNDTLPNTGGEVNKSDIQQSAIQTIDNNTKQTETKLERVKVQ